MHQKFIQNEITSLQNNKNINPVIYLKFLKRLKSLKYLRTENPINHFCAFFLPIDLKKQEIYLGHHKKANDWIPPGGHIEPNEHPLDTIKREIFEELQFKLTTEKIELFDLTIKNIQRPNSICKIHYDLWYLVYMEQTNFIFDPREFYTAKWLTKQQAQTVTQQKDYREIIQKVIELFL